VNPEAAPAEPDFCGFERCEIKLLLALLESEYVSAFEATRWVVAAQFTGSPRLGCAKVSVEYVLTIDVTPERLRQLRLLQPLQRASP
jgi:hypothetical protein